jgi:hypothetical protein
LFWASSLNSTLRHLVQSALFLKCYPHGDTTGGRIGFDKPVEVGLHTVVLNKVISYLILLYNKSTFPGYFTCGLVCGLVYNGHLAGTGWTGWTVCLSSFLGLCIFPQLHGFCLTLEERQCTQPRPCAPLWLVWLVMSFLR